MCHTDRIVLIEDLVSVIATVVLTILPDTASGWAPNLTCCTEYVLYYSITIILNDAVQQLYNQ